LSEGVRRRVQKAENLLWISGQAVAERLANVVSEMVKPSATP
jgi:hypothetical protein